MTGLVGVSALAWIYLVVTASGMDGMDGMNGMAEMAGIRDWTPTVYVLTLLMWVVMMAAMMLPTAIPMTLIAAAVARKARSQGSLLPSTSVFVAGYLVVWAVFSVAATTVQLVLERVALLSSTMVSTSPTFGGVLLIAAGAYQFTPLKEACLRHCRSPAEFLANHWRSTPTGMFTLGLRAGAYCLGCCWMVMALLFVGGVMNLLWVAAITFFVLVEKVLPLGELSARLAGAALILIGVSITALAAVR